MEANSLMDAYVKRRRTGLHATQDIGYSSCTRGKTMSHEQWTLPGIQYLNEEFYTVPPGFAVYRDLNRWSRRQILGGWQHICLGCKTLAA